MEKREKQQLTTTGKIYASKTETMQKICGWERIELRHLCEALCVGYDTTVPYNFTHTAFALHKHAQICISKNSHCHRSQNHPQIHFYKY